jgi:nitrous oxidase accessory protein NosD
MNTNKIRNRRWSGCLYASIAAHYLTALAFCLLIVLPVHISAVSHNSLGNISIAGTEKRFDTLSNALRSAKDGDIIELNGGIHRGNFIIDKSITLVGIGSGDALSALDGEGHGTVVTIAADNVVIDNLEIRNSGHKSTYKTTWGDAGVLVDADNATLRRLKIPIMTGVLSCVMAKVRL